MPKMFTYFITNETARNSLVPLATHCAQACIILWLQKLFTIRVRNLECVMLRLHGAKLYFVIVVAFT